MLSFLFVALTNLSFSTTGDTEAAKLQKHLNLLRQEYVKLQNKTLDLEQKLATLSASSGNISEDTFASKLLKTVHDLHDKETFA